MSAALLSAQSTIVSPEQIRTHWQGHRNLTRRVIDAFPEEALFSYSVGGMRPFAELAMEFVRMAVPGVRGAATAEWAFDTTTPTPTTKAELLATWDATTTLIDELFPTIPEERWQQTEVAYGMWSATIFQVILYAIENEVHHRGQGYVYLRALGIEPPAFYER